MIDEILEMIDEIQEEALAVYARAELEEQGFRGCVCDANRPIAAAGRCGRISAWCCRATAAWLGLEWPRDAEFGRVARPRPIDRPT